MEIFEIGRLGAASFWRVIISSSYCRVKGSEITWFGDDAGFSRKFDLHPVVDCIFNLGAAQLDLTTIRGASSGKRTRLFPTAEETDDQVLGAQDARLYSVNEDEE